MTTTLFVAYQELSKLIGDYWASTTTSAGTTSALIDSALKGKSNDWVTDNTYVILAAEPAGSAAIYDERKVTSLEHTSGTLTTLPFAAAPGTGLSYNLNRLFSPSEQRQALVAATKGVFPYCYNKVYEEASWNGHWETTGSEQEDDSITKVYIKDLGLAPYQMPKVSYYDDDDKLYHTVDIYNCSIDDTYLYLRADYREYTLIIEGRAYLDFTVNGASSTVWTSTINLADPQLRILLAEAAVYLYSQLVGSYTSGGSTYANDRLKYWAAQRAEWITQFAMAPRPVKKNWGF
jgi:hypothetical protein